MLYLYYALIYLGLGLLVIFFIKLYLIHDAYSDYRKTKSYKRFQEKTELPIGLAIIFIIIWPITLFGMIFKILDDFLDSATLERRLLEWYDKKKHPEDYL